MPITRSRFNRIIDLRFTSHPPRKNAHENH
jgi:hypothetical protein